MSAPVQNREEKGRKAIKGAFFGFYVDMFDIYLPVIVLAPAINYFVSPELSDAQTSLITGAIFAATLIGRPIGALIFGHHADKLGRKRATLISVSGFGVLTVVLGCLPGYETLGMTAVVLFVLLRFLIGIFVGGEYTAASPLAMEYSPKEKRGINSARVMLGFPLAYVTISTLTLIMLQVAPDGAPDSAYSVWGWRIPFFVGGLLALAFVVYFSRQVEESDVFEADEDAPAPVKQLFESREAVVGFAQVFLLMTGFWLSLNAVTALMPSVLKDTVGLSGTQSSVTLIIAFAILTGGYLAAGSLSQRVGRRRFMIAYGLWAAVVGTTFYYVLLSTKPSALVAVIALVTLTVLSVNACWGMITAYINERFHTGVRASGFGLGYSLAVILPSFYAGYQDLLGRVMDSAYTPLPLLVIGGLLITLGAVLGPETRDVDLAAGTAQAEEPKLEPSNRFRREPTAVGARES